MLHVLKNRTYARLFQAQVIALLGTGLLTVALGLLAFDLAGQNAGAVLGTAYTIKMIAYVALAPVAHAAFVRLPRKAVMISADLIRAGVALMLPFVDAVWQIYVLILLLQVASATFTPAFQATIPDILTDDDDYTNALSLSRLAYDLENLLSPALAALALTVMGFHWLFLGTVAGFIASAVLVAATTFTAPAPGPATRTFRDRLTRGSQIYLATPRLRGLLALNFTAAAAGGFVLVNSVVLVRVDFAGDDRDVAYLMAAFGAGSMLAALVLPRMLRNLTDKAVMIPAAVFLGCIATAIGGAAMLWAWPAWGWLLVLWAILGLCYAAILTPAGRLLRRSARDADRPAIFAAQFALSHACWLITYPIAGWAGARIGLPATMAVLGIAGLLAAALAWRIWPAGSGEPLAHDHPDLPADHPHLRAYAGHRHHAHVFVIDDEHHVWPTHG